MTSEPRFEAAIEPSIERASDQPTLPLSVLIAWGGGSTVDALIA